MSTPATSQKSSAQAGSNAAGRRRPSPANRLRLDYTAEAARLAKPPVPIIDVHSHISGRLAAPIFKRVMQLYGIERVYTMSPLEEVQPLRDLFGDAMQFIAVPNYWGDDRRYSHGPGFVERIGQYADLGAKIAKFWAAPRGIEYGIEVGQPDLLTLDAPHRIEAMQAAYDRGMMFMVHVADPDTWFAKKYADASVFGTKRDHYTPLRRVLEMFDRPWIAAHMGGWPEDLDFLDELLASHDNLYLDTSATKWMVRELSRHSRERFVEFMTRWKGRILFGSDIVTTDDHVRPAADAASPSAKEKAAQAASPDEAFDLYASRYWAQRTMFETEYDGESPIADPDLAMVDPERYDAMDAPHLRGRSLPVDLLKSIYRETIATLPCEQDD